MNALLLLLATASAVTPQDTAYFQQGVDYRIEARLDESTDVLHARARLNYTNHAPATIDTLFVQLNLNAFRPNSAWATRELKFDNRRFQDLGPDDYAYERLKSVKIGNTAITSVYPGAPDSTVVAFPLPAPLATGAQTTVLIDWDSRLSTTPRRQGRRGRHYDFAQWYPRIAVVDRDGWEYRPLLPQGEFYGEFASYDVTLDVAADQVIGATGVPVEGDPGWKEAMAGDTGEPLYKRDAYPAKPADDLGFLDGAPDAGRKRVRWRAENVHHFAWTTSPDYIYEQGSFEDVAIHVLYQPGDTAWANGVAVRRTAGALAYYDTLFGDYAWPQLTNVHRIESGGTEFPMMIMNGSAGEGLIMHETAHQYAHGMLANNEWKQGWMDEGFASFVTNLYYEDQGRPEAQIWGRSLQNIREMEKAGATQPISMASADFRDFQTYNAMTYTKPSLVLRMLRDLVGDTAFREGLRLYFDRNKLHHVREQDFEAAMEQTSGKDLNWFFEDWIHTTDTLDYSVGQVSTTQQPDGTWTTRIEVLREGEAYMPVHLRVGETERLLDSRDRRQTVTVTTPARPDQVILDPGNVLIDLNPANNTEAVAG